MAWPRPKSTTKFPFNHHHDPPTLTYLKYRLDEYSICFNVRVYLILFGLMVGLPQKFHQVFEFEFELTGYSWKHLKQLYEEVLVLSDYSCDFVFQLVSTIKYKLTWTSQIKAFIYSWPICTPQVSCKGLPSLAIVTRLLSLAIPFDDYMTN